MTAVEHQQWLETVSEKGQPAITHTFAVGGPLGRALKNFLHGAWLGHPLHPVLTDIPSGAWATALVLDGLEVATGRPACGRSAKTAIKVGLIGALGAAITKNAEKPRHSCRGWIGVGRAGLNAQEPNNTHAVPEPSMGEGTAEVEAPAFMPGRMSQ